MPFRLTLALGFAIGYVLGSKAGRQRYEQIMRTARKLKDSPSVQGAAGVLQAQADTAIGAVKHKIGSGAPSYPSNGHRR
ncbi:MAG: hypothetical protein H0T66_11390 [Geodermatophilaceae bacterium]|nr:hypothetical protein [Geodermatophilaceae bacterium]MDQ3455437.1 hypothetical protein [Actinomycetota bacterium]